MPKTSFYSGTGITSEKADAVESSANAAAQSAANAATSETNALTSETNAATSENNADTSETNAAASEANAATSKASALTSETNAATSEANALASATTAQNLEITSASFDTTDGTLTLTKANSGTVTTALDGRYLTSYTETDPVFSAHASSAITSTQISNWDTAYASHQNALGKADLSGATFTGKVDFSEGVQLPRDVNLEIGNNSYGNAVNLKIGQTVSGSNFITANSTLRINCEHTTIDSDLRVDGDIVFTASQNKTVDGRNLTLDGYKLDNIDTGATANDTDANLKARANHTGTQAISTVTGLQTALDGKVDTVVGKGLSTQDFTDAEKTKLSGIEANATADQTGAEIKSAYEAVADTNAYTDAEKTKLSVIEASADVTDTANVTSAGALMTAGGTMSGNITCHSGVTVDGRNVSADGTKLDTIATNATADPYYRVSELRLAGTLYHQNLTSSDQNLGQYEFVYHLETPEKTIRFADVEWSTYWDYVSSSVNDTRLTLQLVVPSYTSSSTLQNLGYVTEVSQYAPYATRGSGQKWYSVSGDVTHHFTQFGRMSQSSTGALEHTIVSYQYVPSSNQTFFCLQTSGLPMSTGNVAYWHPYAWESAGTTLTQSYEITERYRTGEDRNKVSFKLPFTSSQFAFSLKIKELGNSGDSAKVSDSVVKLTSMGV